MARRQSVPRSVAVRGITPTYLIDDLRDQFVEYDEKVRGHSKWTLTTRRTHLKQFVQFCRSKGITDVRTLTIPIMDEYFAEFEKTHSKSTTNTARRILKVFLRWVNEYKELSHRANPDAIRLTRERDATPKAIPNDIVARVIKGAENEQDALAIAVFFETGARVGEIVNLRVYDFYRGRLHIRGKGEVDRFVYVTPRLAYELEHFFEKNDRYDTDFIFQNVYNGYGEQMSIKTMRKRVQACFEDVVGVRMVPHQLRHTFAINLLQGGTDIVTIQKLLGHKDISTTMVYLRVADNFVRDSYLKGVGKSILDY